MGVPLALSANKGCVLDRQHDPELLAELLDRNGNRRAHIGLAAARARKLRNGSGCLRHRFHGDLLFPVGAAAGPEEKREASANRGNDPAHARKPAVTAYGLPSDPVEGFPDLLNGYLPLGRVPERGQKRTCRDVCVLAPQHGEVRKAHHELGDLNGVF